MLILQHTIIYLEYVCETFVRRLSNLRSTLIVEQESVKVQVEDITKEIEKKIFMVSIFINNVFCI